MLCKMGAGLVLHVLLRYSFLFIDATVSLPSHAPDLHAARLLAAHDAQLLFVSAGAAGRAKHDLVSAAAARD